MENPQTAAPNPAQMYEQLLVRFVFNPLADRLLAKVPPRPGASVIDIATGTGIVLRKIAEQYPGTRRMVGIDLNPMMLDVGRAIAEEQNIPIEWQQADATQTSAGDGEFDMLYCQQGLQFFPDRTAAIKEFHRILRDDGTAVIAVWQGLDRHHFARIINEAALAETGKPLLQGPFSLNTREELESLATTAGFREITVHTVEFTAYFEEPDRAIRMMIAGGTAAIPELQKLPDTERAELVENVASRARPHLEQWISDGRWTLDWTSNVGVARK